MANSIHGYNEEIKKTTVLSILEDPSAWGAYLRRKRETRPDDPRLPKYERLCADPETRRVAREIAEGTHGFSVPRRIEIPKPGSTKKRVVYEFDDREMMCLRLVASELGRYDRIFPDCLYSFRSTRGVGDAVRRIRTDRRLGGMWACKADIHDYFNSIPARRALDDLRAAVDDAPLTGLLERMLSDDRCLLDGEVVTVDKGVMAGLPTSPFMANRYLHPVDESFAGSGVPYLRYADDVLFFADTEEEIDGLRARLESEVSSLGLEMNPDKYRRFRPGEPVEFLGFTVEDGVADLSRDKVEAKKSQIRSFARQMRGWANRKHIPTERAGKAVVNRFNEVYYGKSDAEFTWARWYLPVVTTDASLREIDRFEQEWVRWAVTGRHSRSNLWKVPYETMRGWGYRPLVSAYRGGSDARSENPRAREREEGGMTPEGAPRRGIAASEHMALRTPDAVRPSVSPSEILSDGDESTRDFVSTRFVESVPSLLPPERPRDSRSDDRRDAEVAT